MEGSAVSASHLPDCCRENGLEIWLPEGTKIPIDVRVFVLYQGNQPDGSTYARCPLRLRKQNASLEKVFTASIPSLNTTTEEGAQLGWVFGFVEDYENLAMLLKLAMGG